MNILVPLIVHVVIQNALEWTYCTFCKCCFRLFHRRVSFYSFSAAKILELSSKFRTLIYPNFLWSTFLVITSENVLAVSFESFVFIPFGSTVLSNKSWRTSKYFTSRINWKLRVEIFSRKDKNIVQSRDQANNSLDLHQPCDSSQVLYRFVFELLQHPRVILHVVWILWSSEIQSPSTSLHNQWFHQI